VAEAIEVEVDIGVVATVVVATVVVTVAVDHLVAAIAVVLVAVDHLVAAIAVATVAVVHHLVATVEVDPAEALATSFDVSTPTATGCSTQRNPKVAPRCSWIASWVRCPAST